MDRKIVYAGQIPLSAQFLQAETNKMRAFGYVAEAMFGTDTVVDGLVCIPTVPATLVVQLTPGQIFQLAPVDDSAFGSLPVDVHNIHKQGINVDTQSFTLVPPVTSGHAIDYLIQVALTEDDADELVLPYVNSANPSLPFTGPNNSGTSQPTTRRCRVQISAKAGVSATAGDQTPPAPDAGFTGLYVVTVAHGATQLSSAEIRQLDLAPFVYQKLHKLPRWVQSGEFLWGDDTGTANAIVAKLAPVPTQYTKGMHIFVKKVAAANTGNITVNLVGPDGALLGAVALLDATGAQIGAGNMPGSCVLHAVHDGTAFRWVNGSITNTSISSITATSGEGVVVGGEEPYPVSLNYPGLNSGTPTALDLLSFYDNEGAEHKVITWASFLALLSSLVQPTLATLAPVLMSNVKRAGAATAQSAVGGVWTRRTLNNTVANQISGASVAGNGQITLPAGTYRCSFGGSCFGAGNHKARVYNVTGSVVLGEGLTGDSHPQGATPGGSGHNTANLSVGDTRFTLGVTSVVELQHYSMNTTVLGDTSDTGAEHHVDAFVTLTKEA
jgi:hypothetical protein